MTNERSLAPQVIGKKTKIGRGKRGNRTKMRGRRKRWIAPRAFNTMAETNGDLLSARSGASMLSRSTCILVALLLLVGCIDQVPDKDTESTLPDTGNDVGILSPNGGCGSEGSWVTVPPASTSLPVSFEMGASDTDACVPSTDGRETRHTVSLTGRFELQATEVTKDCFSELMGYDSSWITGVAGDCPVEGGTWHEVIAYCNTLSTVAGLAPCYSCEGTGPDTLCVPATGYEGGNIYSCPGYRLATEAEWEFAYRAGTDGALYNGELASCGSSDPGADAIAWYQANLDSDMVHPVGTKEPNAWGLWDMAGNVGEWTHDSFQQDLGSAPATNPTKVEGAFKVVKGGSYGSSPLELRGAARSSLSPEAGSAAPMFGIRCARSLP